VQPLAIYFCSKSDAKKMGADNYPSKFTVICNHYPINHKNLSRA